MTLKELEQSLINRRQGLGNNIYRLAMLVRSPFAKDFPDSPKKAFPDLYPQEKGIPMPDFLKDKAIKRGVL